jgi:hypothetical protein
MFFSIQTCQRKIDIETVVHHSSFNFFSCWRTIEAGKADWFDKKFSPVPGFRKYQLFKPANG